MQIPYAFQNITTDQQSGLMIKQVGKPSYDANLSVIEGLLVHKTGSN